MKENDLLHTKFNDKLIPITRFNHGEASRIFEEVKQSGVKVVVKNNKAICVLISPEQYSEILELNERIQSQLEQYKEAKGVWYYGI